MADKKGKLLETVLEDVEEGLAEKTEKGNVVSSAKSDRNAVKKRTKKVVVTIPTESTRPGGKKFPKGLEASKREENEIKMNSSSTSVLEKQYIQTGPSANENGKAEDNRYDAFSRTNTEHSFIEERRDSKTTPKRVKLGKKDSKRPKSSTGFTQRELDLFLPRKSFFNAHDKVLIEAGKQVDTLKERKKPDWHKILKMHTMEELYPVEPEPEKDPKGDIGLLEESDNEELFALENVETAVSSENHPHTKSKKKPKQKVVANDKEEYKMLYDYFKYIKEHPEEYVAMAKYTPKNIDYRHPNNFVRLGRVYRRAHHGNTRNSMFIHALGGLKLTETTTSRTRTDKEPGNVEQTATSEETEIEKLRSKTEKWMRGLTTQQVMKAKEMALKDIGEEDICVSKWWLAFKSCKYLRVPKHDMEVVEP